MEKPFRWEVNVQTGERQRIELTDAEIADAQMRTATENAANAIRQVEVDRKAVRQALMDRFIDRLEIDPDLIDRLARGV